MAITLAKWLGDYPVRGNRPEMEVIVLAFETNGTSAPDGLDPNVTGVALGRTGVGDLTVTFAEDIKPNKVLACIPSVVEDTPQMEVKYTGYTKSTGVLTLTTYDEDDTSGIQTQADSTNQTISLVIFATRSENA